uniref:Uncharacterized protein n=1 Tax=Sarcophilus harrisii TaxID=9305 RepID=A0A7N4P8M8_SARHA
AAQWENFGPGTKLSVLPC